MRSSTIFILFGALLIAIVLYMGLSQRSMKQHPVMQKVQIFFKGMRDRNEEMVKETLDLSIAHPIFVKSSLVSISFPDYTPPHNVVFTHMTKVSWTYNELSRLDVDNTLDLNPDIDENSGLASVILTEGHRVYLHLVNDEWKIFYIQRKPEER